MNQPRPNPSDIAAAGRQQPHPRPELRLHIQHPLTRGDQMLSQQMAQPARALDPLRPSRYPRHQPLRLCHQSTHPAAGRAAPHPRRSYEIDLIAQNAATFSKRLAPYIAHARRGGRAQLRSGRMAASRHRSGDIRAWANEHDVPVSERGRISASAVDQYFHDL
jgi:Lsr2